MALKNGVILDVQFLLDHLDLMIGCSNLLDHVDDIELLILSFLTLFDDLVVLFVSLRLKEMEYSAQAR